MMNMYDLFIRCNNCRYSCFKASQSMEVRYLSGKYWDEISYICSIAIG